MVGFIFVFIFNFPRTLIHTGWSNLPVRSQPCCRTHSALAPVRRGLYRCQEPLPCPSRSMVHTYAFLETSMNHAQSQPTFSRVAVEWLASESVRARDYSGLIMHTARVGAFPAHGYLLQSSPKLVTCQNNCETQDTHPSLLLVCSSGFSRPTDSPSVVLQETAGAAVVCWCLVVPSHLLSKTNHKIFVGCRAIAPTSWTVQAHLSKSPTICSVIIFPSSTARYINPTIHHN